MKKKIKQSIKDLIEFFYKNVFNDAYEAGRANGIDEGMAMVVEKSHTLTDQEYGQFVEFMIRKNLTVTYTLNSSPMHHIGLQVRKANSNQGRNTDENGTKKDEKKQEV